MNAVFIPIHRQVMISLTLFDNSFRSLEQDKEFLRRLVKAVGMKAVTDPHVAYVGEPGNKGNTGSINLATSHAAFHHWEENGRFEIDLYSCKWFDENVVLDIIRQDRGEFQVNMMLMLDRDTGNVERII